MQLKSAAKLSAMVGLITKHDIQIIANTFVTYYYFSKVIRKFSPTHNLFEFVY